MPTTVYNEPGVFLYQKRRPSPSIPVDEPAIIPIIIGEGISKKIVTTGMVRGTGTTDILPSTKIESITQIGVSRVIPTWAETTDYTLTGDPKNTITWVTGKGPAAGETYYVTYVAFVEETQYELKYVGDTASAVEIFGESLDYTSGTAAVNSLSLAAQNCLQAQINANKGNPGVYVLQVKPGTGGTVAAAEYQASMNAHLKEITTAYRVVPISSESTILAAIAGFIVSNSTPEERREMTGITAISHGTMSTFDEIFNTIGTGAASINNPRMVVVYPDKAVYLISTGLEVEVGSGVIAAAIAGMEYGNPVQQPLTRSVLPSNFKSLVGVPMTRTEKNRLASQGVMVLENTNGGIVIRHQLTTSMETVESREMSVGRIVDYAAKYLRNSLEGYIGKRNIDAETLVTMEATLRDAKNRLVSERIVKDITISEIMQVEGAPDTLAFTASVQPPYPCNRVEIILLVG